jgi:two-component system invasion response regulator UvrY
MLDDPTRSNSSGAHRSHPSLAVVDLSLTPGEAGLGLVRRLRRRFPKLKLIVVADRNDVLVGRSALDAGANGLVPKHAVATDLAAAVDAVLAGRHYLSPAVPGAVVH